MIQCKICGTPLKDDTDEILLEHWKGQHAWHWANNKNKTAREAIIKQR